jgi:AraC-like DNA-binding protein
MIDRSILELIEKEKPSPEDIACLIDRLAHLAMKSSQTTSSKVNIFLRSKLRLHGVNREEVAAFLNVSTRTLSRKLKSENTGFHRLLDEERKRRCYQYLQRDIVCGQELTELLGLSDISHFYRSFKQWSGQSFSETKSKLAEKHGEIDTIIHRHRDEGER